MATGASGTLYNNSEFLFRLQTLIIDGGTDVIRHLFDQRLQNVALTVVLANEKNTIMVLKQQKTISKTQYNLLYPPAGQPPDSKFFDITLILCLLRNLPSLALNQSYKWNVPPQPTDTSVEADLCRLRGFRNEIAHISSTRGFHQLSFEAKWTEIEQVLLRLNSTLPKPLANFKQTVDSFKYSPIDSAAEKRIQAIIQQWRDMERGLEAEMLLIKRDVSETKQDVKHLTEDVSNTRQTVENIKKDFSETKQDNKRLTEDVTYTMQNVEEIKKDFSETVQGVNDIKKDVSDTKQYVWNIRTDVSEMKQDVEFMKKDMNIIKQGRTLNEDADTAYAQLISEFQDELISFYKRQHKSMPLSPLMKEDPPLLEFYVMPDIKSVKVKRSRDGDKEEKTSLRKLHDVFYEGDKLCHNILLTADAGLGKTAFSKRLALTWCHSKKPDKSKVNYFSEGDITDMDDFKFVFLVLLRDSHSECDVDMLIFNQICSQLSRDITVENLKNILHRETCLVILDGLDEWTHPMKTCSQRHGNIPHQRVRDNVVVLTTTRPWKLSLSDLHSSRINRTLELTGLSNDSTKSLKKSVIAHLFGEQDESKLHEYEAEFNRTVQQNHKTDLTCIPLFLMYFLFLWYYKFNVGKSLADLYCSIIELLLSRTEQKDGSQTPNEENAHGNIPRCFDSNTMCRQFYTLLTALGKLAFQMLFNRRKENRLVFDGCEAEKYISKGDLSFCLKTGILTQSKVQGASLLEQKTKLSFSHKTIQEFFAALHIHSTLDQRSIPEVVASTWECVKDILDMSKMIMFLVSLNVNKASAISRELMNIINQETVTQEYRNSFGNSWVLKNFQDMFISCCKEFSCENEVSLCLQDVFIDKSCQQEQYCRNLKQLSMENKQNIKSLYIDLSALEYTPINTAEKVIDYFALNSLRNITKIYYKNGKYNDVDISPLLNSSVKCFSLSCCWPLGSRSRLLFEKVTRFEKLEDLHISGFEMSHRDLRMLLDYISHRNCMKEIKLEWLDCNDHWSSCTGLGIDLSRHVSLRKLVLGWLPLSLVNVSMASQEECYLCLCNRDLKLEFLDCTDSKLSSLYCSGLESSVAVAALLDTLCMFRHVRKVEFSFISLGAKTLSFSPSSVNMKCLNLYKVTLNALKLRELVDSVIKLPQTVKVYLERCTFSSTEEFEIVKEYIKTLPLHFRILEDLRSEFAFETIKDRD